MRWGVLLFLIPTLVLGDRGMLPVYPNISIYEPGQKGIIIWNGETEVLILGVDAYAEKGTKVVEIIPLPGKPTVDSATPNVFYEVQKLIKKYRPKLPYFRGRLPSVKSGAPTGVEILFHKKIGPHNITSVKVLNYSEFVKWVYKFIKSQNIDTLQIPDEFPSIVRSYITQGILYFVFDIIELKEEIRSITPLRYEFKSPYLYYPLNISRLSKGGTNIQLFLITEHPPWPGEIKDFKFAKYFGGWRRMREVEIMFRITKKELAKIDKKSAKMFNRNPTFTAIYYKGDISSLTYDLTVQRFCKLIHYFKR